MASISSYRSSLLFLLMAGPLLGEEVIIEQSGPKSNLRMESGDVFYSTNAEVTDARAIAFDQSSTVLAVWNEVDAIGASTPYYAISFDGAQFPIIRQTSYEIGVALLQADPLRQLIDAPEGLQAIADNKLYIIQFVTQPLDEYRATLAGVGAKILHYIPQHAYLVEISDTAKAQLQTQTYVRWVGPYHPAYKIPGEVRDQINAGPALMPPQRYRISVQQSGLVQKAIVGERITLLGGTVDVLIPSGFMLEATLTGEQLLVVLSLNEVLSVDLWHPIEYDMNFIRQTPPFPDNVTPGGAYYLEQTAGYTGGECAAGGSTGHCVRAEVADANIDVNHQDWALPLPGRSPIIHGQTPGGSSNELAHGIAVFGIVFSDGSSDGTRRWTRGMMPTAQGIFADADGAFGITLQNAREQHTCQLAYGNCGDVSSPYKAVFQTNSWGSDEAPTHEDEYSNETKELDYVAFTYDVLLLHSQGNSVDGGAGFTEQSLAKNIVTVSGVVQNNNLTLVGDRWNGSTNEGPTFDGRLKPDLVHAEGDIFTSGPSNSTQTFGLTSGSTPITAGNFGLFFQMWADDADGDGDGLFGNSVASCDPVTENCVFKRRPHMTTAKAMMINTARGYPVPPPNQFPFLQRQRQGWGLADVKRLYDVRSKFFIVDETDLVTLSQSAVYYVLPEFGQPLKATLVYADPAAMPFIAPNLVNNLELRVTSPTGTVYWGNIGLGKDQGDWSTSGGSPITKDTVENVFIQNPEMGAWKIEVIASDLTQDGHVIYLNDDPSTCFNNYPGCVVSSDVDADFALVVSAVSSSCRVGQAATDLDCNGNDIPDLCDIGLKLLRDCDPGPDGVPDICVGSGDVDFDCDVDLSDYAYLFNNCLRNPDDNYPLGIRCIYLDIDKDDDCDLSDVASFQNVFGDPVAACSTTNEDDCTGNEYAAALTISTNLLMGATAVVFPNPLWLSNVELTTSDGSLLYESGTQITLTAQAEQGSSFLYWELDGVPQQMGQQSVTVNIEEDCTARAVYASPPAIAWNTDDLSAEQTSRSLRFAANATADATGPLGQSAIKVTMIDLQNPNPPNLPQYPPPDFSAYESGTCTAVGETNDCARWLGKPGTFLESQDNPGLGNYRASRLQCTPFYFDWVAETANAPIAVVGAEIAPSSEYNVQAFSVTCEGSETGCLEVSIPVTMLTRRSGDLVAAFNPPATSTQPDVIDVSQLVNKVKNLSGAPVKAISQLQPNVPQLNGDVNVLDVVAVVDAVKQFAYPLSGPCPCPSLASCGTFECTTQSKCTATNICVGGTNNGANCTPPLPPSTCIGGVCTLSTSLGLGPGAQCIKTCNAGGPNAGQPCANDTHCPGGLVCSKGIVGAACENDDECDTQRTCNSTNDFCLDASGKVCGTGCTPGQPCHCDGMCNAPTTNFGCGVGYCRDRCGRCTP